MKGYEVIEDQQEEYFNQLKSNIADLQNTSSKQFEVGFTSTVNVKESISNFCDTNQTDPLAALKVHFRYGEAL